tara:strand:- start:23847 stop:24401 length:555 start_codon:yes stop_codon:yes gene_type:complete
MGLDISIYREVIPLEMPPGIDFNTREWDEYNEKNGVIHPGNDPLYLDWVGNHQEVAGDYQDGLYQGYYSEGFRAGSYSGFDNWKVLLSMIVDENSNTKDWKERPFIALLGMGVEGFIGYPMTSKLCNEFRGRREEVETKSDLIMMGFIEGKTMVMSERERFLDRYDSWERGFCLTKEEGILLFH